METAELSKLRLAQSDIHEQWDSDYLNPDVDKFYDAAFAKILEALGDTSGKTILDIGCGYCYHTKRLARSNLKITAVDFAPPALEQAKAKLQQAGIADRVILKREDATDLSFSNASFDHVLIWGVLMHIPEVEKALTEAIRVLKPGGILVLSENNAHSLEVRLVEPSIELVRRMAGKAKRIRRKAPLGIEEWQGADQGGLMVRKTNIPALTRFLAAKGLTLEMRLPGQFTELYARVPTQGLKRLIHRFNLSWFNKSRSPAFALGNILVFQRKG